MKEFNSSQLDEFHNEILFPFGLVGQIKIIVGKIS